MNKLIGKKYFFIFMFFLALTAVIGAKCIIIPDNKIKHIKIKKGNNNKITNLDSPLIKIKKYNAEGTVDYSIDEYVLTISDMPDKLKKIFLKINEKEIFKITIPSNFDFSFVDSFHKKTPSTYKIEILKKNNKSFFPKQIDFLTSKTFL